MPRARRILGLAGALLLLVGCVPAAPPESPAPGTDSAKADAVMKIVRDTMAGAHLKAVIVRVTVDGKEVVTQAVGESMTGVPATTDMHFRNGAVAISYVSTLLLMLVDEKKVGLDDKLSKWLPEVPHADQVTLGQLAQMTSGYVDYVIGNTEIERRAVRRSVPAVDDPRSCSAYATSTSRCCTSRARTGTTPTPTTCCWAWRWRRRPARRCRSCCGTRCWARWG